MTDEADLGLSRKWTLRAHGRQVVLWKKPRERTSHVLMKAFLWTLYLPDYPELTVEVSAGDRYKPDVVAFDGNGRPAFWGEAGHVGEAKLRSIVRRYPQTHIALAKWQSRLGPFRAMAQRALRDTRRSRPFDLLRFPADGAERFIDPRGRIRLRFDEIEWIRFPCP